MSSDVTDEDVVHLKDLLEQYKSYSVGRRKLNDILFINDKPLPRLGVYDFDEENLCHKVVQSTCYIPGCKFTSESLLEFENHYNASHRYACSQCKKNLPTPHLFHLHIQETRDSFFAVLAERKPSKEMLEQYKSYGVGRRKLDDILFINDKPPPRLGVYDFDEENLCHKVVQSTCNIPGCKFMSESLLEFENHYNASHRYACSQCKKNLPSPHLLDLHIQETHDSFFAVLAERKPSYCCYIEECKEKFKDADERLQHCVKEHKLPKDFRFESKPKSKTSIKSKTNKNVNTNEASMELDDVGTSETKNKFVLNNSKQKTFPKYSGKKFTKSKIDNISKNVNIDEVMSDLKESLPE